jgi:hypothetical protein
MFELGGKSVYHLQEPNIYSPLRCGILDANPLCSDRLEMAFASFWGSQLLVMTPSLNLFFF